jgi:tryptophan synthase alpha chain
MATIAAAFARARQENRLALIGYLPAGFPDALSFVELAHHAFAAGLDILEIGLPTPDPKYDGEVIKRALQKVVNLGIDTRTALDLGEQAINGGPGAGLAMFYDESLTTYGPDQLLKDCLGKGISGVLPVGVEPHHWLSFARTARNNQIAPIGFIPYGMDEATLQAIAGLADGFLYLQSQSGPTGQQGEFGDEVRERVTRVKTIANHKLPVAIGFGVRYPADVERIRNIGADGVIVGTAFLEAAEEGVTALENLVHGLGEAARF